MALLARAPRLASNRAQPGRHRDKRGTKLDGNVRRKPQIETIDQYIEAFPADVRQRLDQMRQAIRSAAPQARQAISYGMPAFNMDGTLVYFGAFKSHIGFYPTSSAIRAFQKELSPYKLSKGAVQFPFDKPTPLALVKEIVRFRVSEMSNDKPTRQL